MIAGARWRRMRRSARFPAMFPAMSDATIELCVESVEGAITAEAGGANRVELCADLVEGGITPSAGSMRMAKERLGIPTMVMIRPRGGDFLYSRVELDIMLHDIAVARDTGVHGVVFGMLDTNGTIDKAAMRELTDAARPLEVTCHRAFDMTIDPRRALDDLMEIGVDRVLTSGQEVDAVLGMPLLAELVKQAGDRIIVMPGGGITPERIREVVETTGCRDVHFAALGPGESPMEYRNPRCAMGATPEVPGEYDRTATDVDLVRRFVAAVRG